MRILAMMVAMALSASVGFAQDRHVKQVILPEECMLDPMATFQYGNELVAKDGLMFVSVRDAIRDGQTFVGLIELQERDMTGMWRKVGEIRPDDRFGELGCFGADLDFDGEKLAISVRGATGGADSAAHVMRRDGAGGWELEARIEAPVIPDWEFSREFADVVAIDGDVLVVTDWQAKPPTWLDDRGAILVYRFENEAWILELIDTAPYRSSPTSFSLAAISGEHVVTTVRSTIDLPAGIRVYDLSAGTSQDLRTDLSYTSADILDGLIAARADRSFPTPGDCGEVQLFERGAGGQFELTEAVEHACNMGFPSGREDEGRRLVLSEDRIVVNGRIDWDGGRYGTMFGSFDLLERIDGVWQRSEELYFSLPGSYTSSGAGKVGGIALDGDSVVLGHQWRGRLPVFSCGDHTGRGALSVYDLSAEYCRADMDGDGMLTIFDFLAFANAFDDRLPVADFTRDSSFALDDYLDFLNQFDAGCGG